MFRFNNNGLRMRDKTIFICINVPFYLLFYSMFYKQVLNTLNLKLICTILININLKTKIFKKNYVSALLLLYQQIND